MTNIFKRLSLIALCLAVAYIAYADNWDKEMRREYRNAEVVGWE